MPSSGINAACPSYYVKFYIIKFQRGFVFAAVSSENKDIVGFLLFYEMQNTDSKIC